MAENADKIVESAQAPKAVETDGLRVTEHSIPDQIAADRYQRQTATADAANRKAFPFRVGHFGGGHPAR